MQLNLRDKWNKSNISEYYTEFRVSIWEWFHWWVRAWGIKDDGGYRSGARGAGSPRVPGHGWRKLEYRGLGITPNHPRLPAGHARERRSPDRKGVRIMTTRGVLAAPFQYHLFSYYLLSLLMSVIIHAASSSLNLAQRECAVLCCAVYVHIAISVSFRFFFFLEPILILAILSYWARYEWNSVKKKNEWKCSLFNEWIYKRVNLEWIWSEKLYFHSFWSDLSDHSKILSDHWGHIFTNFFLQSSSWNGRMLIFDWEIMILLHNCLCIYGYSYGYRGGGVMIIIAGKFTQLEVNCKLKVKILYKLKKLFIV